MPINIAVVDKSSLYRKGISGALVRFGYTTLFGCDCGKDLDDHLDPNLLPGVILVSLDLPKMDAYNSTAWLKEKYPMIRILAMSMADHEVPIIRIMYQGANGFILKTDLIETFDFALRAIVKDGLFTSKLAPRKLVNAITAFQGAEVDEQAYSQLSEIEIKIVKLICAELSDKQIAEELYLTTSVINRTISDICKKLGVHDRLGILLYILKHDLLDFSDARPLHLVTGAGFI